MNVSIDRAGRVVIPKPLRERLGFSPDKPLQADVVDGRLELYVSSAPARLADGAHGPVVAETGVPIGDAEVRDALEAVRERR